MSDPKNVRIGFAGMTHLGVVSSAVLAARGFRTICADADARLIGQLSRGELPVSEPELDSLVAAHSGQLCFTAALADLQQCDVIYVALDVPTDDAGQSDLAAIKTLVAQVVSVMRNDAVLVILCQVPPGFTRSFAGIAPERLYYQVETLVFGIAVQRAREPERYIIGCADPDRPIDPRFAAILEAPGCPILPMRYESAELAKIAINFCLVSSISVANTLSEICENVGADWSEIVPALKLDARIGQKAYLAPGLGIAGGNLERDLATIIGLSNAHKTDAGVVRAWIANSIHRKGWAARIVRFALLAARPRAKLAIWGLAYKENTHSIKNSPSIATIDALPETRLIVHDPLVDASVLSRPVEQCATPLDALYGADALMILTPWPEYRDIAPADISKRLRGKLVLDPYRMLDRSAALAAGLDYRTLGVAATTAVGTL